MQRAGRSMLVGIAVTAGTLAAGLAVRADPYRWCAVGGTSGGTNCGFVTLDQCNASISGVGGSCEPRQILPANLSPAARAAAPLTDPSGGKDRLMDCTSYSCRINCSPQVKKRFRPKWCVYFKQPV